jgi:hypothetical protein
MGGDDEGRKVIGNGGVCGRRVDRIYGRHGRVCLLGAGVWAVRAGCGCEPVQVLYVTVAVGERREVTGLSRITRSTFLTTFVFPSHRIRIASIYSIPYSQLNPSAILTHEKPQEIFGISSFSLSSFPDLFSQLRGKDSSSSKNKPPPPSSTASSTPSSSSSLPPQSSASGLATLPNSSGHNGSTHPLALQPSSQPSRSSVQSAPPQDRRLVVDRATPAPPIVVVSPDTSDHNSRNSGGYGSPERLSIGLEPGGSATPPRTSPLNRLRGPKDTIPIVGKPPRKQRSSRFVVTEKVEIERLPPFLGLLSRFRTFSAIILSSSQKPLPTSAPNFL